MQAHKEIRSMRPTGRDATSHRRAPLNVYVASTCPFERLRRRQTKREFSKQWPRVNDVHAPRRTLDTVTGAAFVIHRRRFTLARHAQRGVIARTCYTGMERVQAMDADGSGAVNFVHRGHIT